MVFFKVKHDKEQLSTHSMPYSTGLSSQTKNWRYLFERDARIKQDRIYTNIIVNDGEVLHPWDSCPNSDLPNQSSVAVIFTYYVTRSCGFQAV